MTGRRLGSPTLARMAGVFSFIVLFGSTSLATTRPLHIMVDPGHGGVDTGATRGKLKESEIALKVAIHLAELLEADPRFRVSLTRTRDERVSLESRTELARKAKADVFLSIHLNSSKDPRAHGKEFYFQNQLPVDEEAMFIASRENAESKLASASPEPNRMPDGISTQTDLRLILEDLRRNERILASSELSQILHETWIDSGHKSGSRAIRQAPFHVVSNSEMPSVLVELGFLSHPREGPRLAQPEYQRELANSLHKGLMKFKETIDKDGAQTLQSAHAN